MEASLNGSRAMEEAQMTESPGTSLIRKSESRSSLFGKKGKGRQSRDRGHSLPRGGDAARFHRQYSSNRIADRGKEMF